MAYDDEMRETEVRKLDALNGISLAIAMLGTNLTTIVSNGLDQNRKLDVMDRKIDRLLDIATRSMATGAPP